MPDHFNYALLLAREIKEKTGKQMLFTDIAQLVRDTDGFVIEETKDGDVRLIFIIKREDKE